jgi:uncharacterized protein YfaS (alpha-2-macroglobulin family)
MKKVSLFSFILILLVSGCSEEQQPNTATQVSKSFNLSHVKKQYANRDFEVADISEQSYQNGAALAVTLSVPLNPKNDFQSFFKVSDKQGQIVKGNWIISNNGLVAYFPEIEPSSTYIVDVYKDLVAATDTKLDKSVSKKIETRKMPAQVSFASQGSILPEKLAKGLPVISVNINEIDVDFFRVKADKMSHFISTWAKNSARPSQSYYYLQEYAAHTELVYSGRFSLNPPKNTRFTTHLDLNSIDNVKQPGVYLAVLKPAGTYAYEKQATFFTVSDLGLHARMYPDQINIQVSSLISGSPLKDVSLTLIDANENILDEVKSDNKGQANFISPSDKARLLIAKNKDNIALLRLNGAALDLSGFEVAGRPYKPIEIFTYGPRDLYRPGETVKINALVRDADAQNIPALPLNAVIKRPDGQKIKFYTLHPNTENQSFYQTAYTLPKNAPTGRWTLELSTTKNNKHHYYFQVEAFLPERMELLLGDSTVQENWTNRTDTISIPVSGQYLYGAPAAKDRLTTKVIIKPDRHPVKSLSAFFFGLADQAPPVEYFETKDIKLDEQGLGTIKIPSRWKKVNDSPFSIKVIASLFETGGRPVTRSINYHSWPQKTLIGIRPHLKPEEIPADTQVDFDIIKSTSEGILQGDTEIIATLIKERRDYYWEYSNAEGWHYEYTEKNFKTYEQRISLTNKQAAKISVPVDWGSYLLIIKDTKTNQSSSLRFHAGNGWRNEKNTSSARPDRIVLKLDKKHYQAGESAKLHILPPYQGNGFVMVENSEKPLWFQRVSLPPEGMTLNIPIDKKWNRHDLYISAVVFRPGDSKEKITPNRAIGLHHLPLNRDNRKLSVNIIVPDTPVRPEQTFSTEIMISGVSADKATYVTLAAVDVGVLNITDFKTPDPHQWFFQARRYAVEQKDIYNKIIELTEGGLTKPRFGGDADKHAGGARPDSSVKIVSLFSSLIKADKNGVAKINLDIPDFNGRLRLMAVAFNNNQFGSSEAEVTITAPIIAESSLPRFLASGDHSTMTLDLRNQSGETQTLSLVVSASPPLKLKASPVSLVLKNKEKKVFYFPIKAEHAFGQAQIDLSIKNSNTGSEPIQINRKWYLGVRPAYPAINFVERKIISAGEKIQIKPPLANLVLASATSDLTISSQPPININQHLKSLLQYPYGCLEQTISSSYPWLSISKENLALLGLDKIKIHNKLVDISSKTTQIDKGISILAGMQRNNGSYGLWSNNDQEEHWLTVYAAEFLLDAREKGFNVPDELFNKTLIRLTQYLNNRGHMYGERYSQAPGHYSFAYKAYAAYILSRVNKAPLGSLRTLFDHHRKQLKSPLPLTHLGLALFKQGDKTRGLQAIKESLTKPRNNLIYLSDYGSRLRDIALMTYLLNKHPIPITETKTLIYQLADELNNRQYLSTQERNALFRAGIQIKNLNNNEWQGQLIVNNTTIKLKQKDTYSSLFIGSENPKNIQYSSPSFSKQPTYLQFITNAYPKTAPKMIMDTIKIERQYYDLEGRNIKLRQHKTGAVLLVHLNVLSDIRIKDALVIDLIPAGFELENQHLSNSLKIDSFKIAGQTIEAMQQHNQVKYQEFLDDRFVAALDLHKNKPEHLFYLIRAVTTGVYTNPPPYAEDMYRPYIRSIGREFKKMVVTAD